MDPEPPVTALLFDMDNTLFDLVGAQIAACDCVVRHLGHDDGDELFSCFLTGSHGFESTENIRQYMQERRIPTNGMYEEACRIYATEKLRHITPYPGVTKTLRADPGNGISNRYRDRCRKTRCHTATGQMRAFPFL